MPGGEYGVRGLRARYAFFGRRTARGTVSQIAPGARETKLDDSIGVVLTTAETISRAL